jgi:hypothetical protein
MRVMNFIAHVQVDYVLPTSQIADTLVKLVQAEEEVVLEDSE